MSAPISPTSAKSKVPAVDASNTDPAGGIAVHGYAPHGHGVEGHSDGSKGVVGTSGDFQGVYGHSDKNAGVVGESATWVGVYGRSTSPDRGAAIMGDAVAGDGVSGSGTAILANTTSGRGVDASSESGEAVHAETHSEGVAAIAAFNRNPDGRGAAIFAHKEGTQGHAGFFDGDVAVTGDLILTGADVAEQFDAHASTPPGSVVVLDDRAHLDLCARSYDRRVAGIVSGLGDRKPAVVLDRAEGITGRAPVAVVGKVWCLADATSSPVGVGDLLTTSPRPGHAMSAVDESRAFGSVIGKALTPLASGTGTVLVLVGLG